ncbi:MAG: hypothetical protein M3Q97_06595 [Bacteroidota bacterium]|nr:hypothetical protein [Bacteroidota bacterium]
MKKLIIIIAFALPALIAGLGGCKKEIPKYTIQGTIQYGSTRLPYADQLISFTLVEGYEPPHTYTELGEARTNDTGGFSFTYEELKTKRYATIALNSQFLSFGGIPDNENVNRVFYRPTHGTLEIYLQTDRPLEENQDTLFIGYPQNPAGPDLNTFIDTITTVNGLYKTIRTTTPALNIFWGRGRKEFYYDKAMKDYVVKYVERFPVEGDPKVNQAIINY